MALASISLAFRLVLSVLKAPTKKREIRFYIPQAAGWIKARIFVLLLYKKWREDVCGVLSMDCKFGLSMRCFCRVGVWIDSSAFGAAEPPAFTLALRLS